MEPKMMKDEDFQALMKESSKVARETARALISGAEGQGHIITAAMAIVIASLEKQHPGVMKDIMTGAVLLKSIDGVELETEEMPPDAEGKTRH